MAELEDALEAFLAPVAAELPEERLRRVLVQAVQGIVGSPSPVVTAVARGVEREQEHAWPLAKRIYRFLANGRFGHRQLLRGLVRIARRAVAAVHPAYLVVALDPVNFEQPDTKKLAAVCTVMQRTPPGPDGEKRRTPGSPAVTAAVVHLPSPVVCYAHWCSYRAKDVRSENREWWQRPPCGRQRRATRLVFPRRRRRFVGDSGLDDQKLFAQVRQVPAEFVVRVSHRNRLVEVYNARLDRWETAALADLVATVPLGLRLEAAFQHARRERRVTVEIGWLTIRLPGQDWPLWLLVAHDPDLDRDLVLLTNVPIRSALDAQTVYTDWRHRPQIEHTYRFDQEDGLDVEDMRVRKLERMRRLFLLVLLAAMFVSHLGLAWPEPAVRWLRCPPTPAGRPCKLGLRIDRDGPYLLLADIRAVFVTAATLAYAAHYPFPRGGT